MEGWDDERPILAMLAGLSYHSILCLSAVFRLNKTLMELAHGREIRRQIQRVSGTRASCGDHCRTSNNGGMVVKRHAFLSNTTA